MANGTPVANPGWDDIQGIFAQFSGQMMWRFNLTSYEDVKANAQIILMRLTTPNVIMPPPPNPPLPAADVETFRNWVHQQCPFTPLAGGAGAPAAPPPAAVQAAPAVPQPTGRDGFRFP